MRGEVSSFLSRSLKTRKTLFPGQPGTKKLVKQYGDMLVCVRYRYDPVRQERVTTVELILDRESWTPDPARIPANKRIPIRVGPKENALQVQVKAAGGRWNPQKRAWELAYKAILEMKLEDRIVGNMEEDSP